MKRKVISGSGKLFIVALLGIMFSIGAGCSITNSPPSAEQIKTDLIGKKMLLNAWSYVAFNSLDEIKEFDIQQENRQGDIVEYKVYMAEEDNRGKIDKVIAKIVYKNEDGKWNMVALQGERLK